jgi:hypothetical protein
MMRGASCMRRSIRALAFSFLLAIAGRTSADAAVVVAAQNGDASIEHARAWLLERPSALIDEVQPDYVKWNSNMFIACDRAGHGHGATDGIFTHVDSLYDLLGALRARAIRIC